MSGGIELPSPGDTLRAQYKKALEQIAVLAGDSELGRIAREAIGGGTEQAGGIEELLSKSMPPPPAPAPPPEKVLVPIRMTVRDNAFMLRTVAASGEASDGTKIEVSHSVAGGASVVTLSRPGTQAWRCYVIDTEALVGAVLEEDKKYTPPTTK